ncbi:osmotically inducible protein OsmC [Spinactinospora alkalitolerans]|uniref:Osmotically inducible protein OsmC n=1 Tax=Spinactinospora alkalitolerans TaxID=687207 RepID=A0A852TW72_9ACTN|nr:OsmC family peroxiredoxin [Spinactinospora alkalitolerans]NYE48249.1 osmotically inducible protein OsmC [Spinactinospora alkalitolerans]
MPVVRTAHTQWEGTLAEGGGTVSFDSSGLPDQQVTWKARSEKSEGLTSPEELIAAAHSSCFSMALSNGLAQGGTPPRTIRTQAEVTFQAGEGIKGIHLTVRASVPDISTEAFAEAAENAKTNCPVSVALSNTPITLDAELE